MESTARYALCVGLTNVPKDDEWEPLIRLSVILRKKIKETKYIKITKQLAKREPYCILEILELLSLDQEEFTHLKDCLYKNEMARTRHRIAEVDEIYVEKEYWRLVEMDNNRR